MLRIGVLYGRGIWPVPALLLSLSVVSCTSLRAPGAEPVLFPRAEIEKKVIARAIEVELKLADQYDVAPPEGSPWFQVIEGPAPIIISAPHATTPTRKDASHRFADCGTGSLAVALHELTGATVILTTYKSPWDPNFYDDNEYKAALAALLKSKRPRLVLDLHASDPKRPYDVDFGTMEGTSLLGQASLLRDLAARLRESGLSNFSQDFFAASKGATVTKWVAERGVPAIQLEISSTWTMAGASDLHAHRFAQLLEALTRFVRSVAPASRG